jgi:hypothetical protein
MTETNYPATCYHIRAEKEFSPTPVQHLEELYLQVVLSYPEDEGRRSIKILVSNKVTSRRP